MLILYEKKEWNEYQVNDKYYLDKIYQEIDKIIVKPKLTLF